MTSYPYYTGQQQQQYYYRPVMEQQLPQQQIGIKGRPVSSIDEVRATTIDFDGSIFYFPDVANKRIYTKQINIDGTSTLNVYELKTEPVMTTQYITREEFESFVNQLKQQQEATTPTQPQAKLNF